MKVWQLIIDMEYKILKDRERADVLEPVCERFGFDKNIFGGLAFFELSKGRVYCVGEGCSGLLGMERVATAGLIFARLGGSVKPSSNIVQIFGKLATRNFLEIDMEMAKKFVSGEDLDVDIAKYNSVTEGYVIIKYQNYPLGVGLLKDGKIKNMLPKGRRIGIKHL